MEYLVITERNHKDQETVLHFCRWNGNEEALTKLMEIIDDADYVNWEGGDYSSFRYGRTRMKDFDYEQIKKISGYADIYFEKYDGTCRMIDDEEIEIQRRGENWEEKCCEFLQKYWRGRLGNLWSTQSPGQVNNGLSSSSSDTLRVSQ